MAITPWSWTASNGTATAAQTVAAYNALTKKDLTSRFSYRVWNDLVTKVHEVNRALGRLWKAEYATYSGTKASRTYDELTEERFNSLRLNTNYPSWRWNYDTEYVGYIGRIDVRGVAGYGDSGADIVYGVYIMEFAERLNTVIGIINGTQPVKPADAEALIRLLYDPELSLPRSAVISRQRQRERIISSAKLTSENLPTLTLHFVIPTAGWKAKLDTEHLSSMLEGYAYISSRFGGTMHRLPPVGLSQVIRSRSDAEAFLRILSTESMKVSADVGAFYESDLIKLHSAQHKGRFFSQMQSSGKAVTAHSENIGWHHVRLMLEPDAGLTQEIKKILEAVGIQRNFVDADIIKAPSANRFKVSGSAGGVEGNALMEQGIPHIMRISHRVSTVAADADINLAQYMESLKAETALKGPVAIAKLEYDHISTMLRAYLTEVLEGRGELETQITGPMNAPVDISVTIDADVISDYAPKLISAIEMLLAIGSTAHTAKAGHGIYNGQMLLTPMALGHTGYASVFDTINFDSLLSITATVTRSKQSNTLIAIGRNGHSFRGDLNLGNTGLMEQKTALPGPSVTGLLDKEFVQKAEAATSMIHGTSGLVDSNSELAVFKAGIAFSVMSQGEMGHVIYATLDATICAFLAIIGDIEVEGGDWEYPVIIGTDAAVFQVWLTEQNREHLFLDPNNGMHHAKIRSGANGTIDKQIRVGASSESNHILSVYGTLDKRKRGNWEYPVQTGGELLITQAIEARPTYQYKLEVK